MRLQRIELDHQFLYVSNYFKTYRYTFDSIKDLTVSDFILFRIGAISLRTRGALGRKIYFLQSRQKFDDFVRSTPDLIAKWTRPEATGSLS